jgi:hypothetical protein
LKNYTDVISPERKLAWVYFSNEWDVSRAFPASECDTIRRQGATPYIRLMLRKNPYGDCRNLQKFKRQRSKKDVDGDTECPCKQGVPHPDYSFEKIINGDFDQDLQEWGRQASKWGSPIIVEWGTECNGCWFWWNGKHNGEQMAPRSLSIAIVILSTKLGKARPKRKIRTAISPSCGYFTSITRVAPRKQAGTKANATFQVAPTRVFMSIGLP